MALRIKCDRCSEIFDPKVDEDANRVSVHQQTEDWDLEGSCFSLGDFCGKCVSEIVRFCRPDWPADKMPEFK